MIISLDRLTGVPLEPVLACLAYLRALKPLGRRSNSYKTSKEQNSYVENDLVWPTFLTCKASLKTNKICFGIPSTFEKL